MKFSYRSIRRIVILMVFTAVFTLSGFGFKKATEPEPTCSDGIKNGQEEGVDCGLFACGNYCELNLSAPQVISTKLIEAGKGDYDFVAEIVNPHTQFGSSEVSYTLKLFNSDEDEILSDKGVFYLLPGQTKFLILPALTTERAVRRTDLKIESVKWQKLDFIGSLDFSVRNDKYTVSSSGLSSKLEGILFNDSDFDFSLVEIDVLLLGFDGKVVAVGKTDVRTLLSRTKRQFEMSWPFLIGERISKIDIRPSTDLFKNSNFVKFYGVSPEQFQQY